MDFMEFLNQNAPCYVYDKEIIENNCKNLKKVIPNVKFLYSIKANPFEKVVETISNQGFGSDAASSNEVLLSIKAGMKKEDIFYSTPGKTEEDIEKVWGKCTIIADSFHELNLIEQKAIEKNCKIDVGVRINPNFSMFDEDIKSSKFGIDEDQFLNANLNFTHLNIVGIHVHVQSQILNPDILARYYYNCFNLANKIGLKYDIKFINFGSGIGTLYNKDKLKEFDFTPIKKVIEDISGRISAKLYIETGRYVVCDSGTFYTPVVDKKVSVDKTYVVVKSGINGFLRPGMAVLLNNPEKGYEPFYTMQNQSQFDVLSDATEKEKVDIVGSLCTALDVLAKDISIKKAEIRDIISISNAGSYAYSLTPLKFASHDLPKEFLK